MHISYTKDRSESLVWLMSWSLLFLIEGMVVCTLIVIFIPPLWLKLALIAAIIGLLSWFVAGGIRAPRRRHHVLTETSLDLHYGGEWLSIPRSRIVAVDALDGAGNAGYVPKLTFDGVEGRVRATFSRQGQIRIILDPPVAIPRKEGVFLARQIVFNADDRDAVMTALDATPVAPHGATPPAEIRVPAPAREPLHGAHPDLVAIETTELTKAYGSVAAVSDLNLRLHAGEIYGFIGSNGAGKTTTMTMLVGLLAPTSGAICIAGHDLAFDPVSAKDAIGYVPDRPVLYETLTGREYLEFIAQMRQFPLDDAHHRIDHLLSTLDLHHRANELCRTYSFGMRNKLSLAAAMLHEPKVLILDEPFNGLDPQTAVSLRALIIDQARLGTCVLLSTHDLSLVERMCHRVGVLDRGRLIAEGRPATIREQADDLESAYLSLTGHGTAP